MTEPPVEPSIADLMVRLKLANRRQQFDQALQRMNQLERHPHPHPQAPSNEAPTDANE